MRDEQPAEQRHREGLHQPVDADRHRDAAPLLPHLSERGEVDLEQHGNDHQPHQHGDGQIDLRHRRPADGAEDGGDRLSERDAGDDAERDPRVR